jgi:hypothetical protein
MRKVNFEATDGINQSHATWLRGRVDWRLAGSWRLSNETFGYDALREWKNFDGYGFDVARALVTRAATSITHDHEFYGNRLTLASDRRFGSRRNRLTIGFETTRNTYFMPRRFGTTTAVDPFAPHRGTFPAETAENFPGAGNFVDFDSTLTVLAFFAEDAFAVAPNVTIVGGGRLDYFDVDRRVNDLNTGIEAEFDKVFKPASGRIGVVVRRRRPDAALRASHVRRRASVDDTDHLVDQLAVRPHHRAVVGDRRQEHVRPGQDRAHRSRLQRDAGRHPHARSEQCEYHDSRRAPVVAGDRVHSVGHSNTRAPHRRQRVVDARAV